MHLVMTYEDIPASGDNEDLKKQKLPTTLGSPLANLDANKKHEPLFANALHEEWGVKRKRKISTRTDNGCRRFPDPSKTVCATFHQQSIKHGLSKFRGFQCTSMALSAVMVSKTLPVDTWRTCDLDAILIFGDRFHVQLLSSIDRRSTDPRIALHEIPSGHQSQCRVPVPSDGAMWFDKDYDLTQVITLSKSDEYYGKVHATSEICAVQDDLGDTPMDASLDAIFRQGYNGVIITVGSVSGAVIKDRQGRVRYFDPHCNNKSGQMNFRGTAVLLAFDSVQQFVRYIRRRDTSGRRRYEMIGLDAITLSIYRINRTTINDQP